MPVNQLSLRNTYGAGVQERQQQQLMTKQNALADQSFQLRANQENRAVRSEGVASEDRQRALQSEAQAIISNTAQNLLPMSPEQRRAATAQIMQNPRYIEAARALGMDLSQSNLDSVSDEEIDAGLRAAAALGQPASQRPTAKDAAGRLRYTDDGSNVFENVDMSGVVTAREKFEQDQAEFTLAQEREARLGSQLSSAMEKTLLEAQDIAFESGNQGQELLVLASEYDANPDMVSGAAGGWWEAAKTAFGSEDAVSLLRRRYAAVRNSLVINNLPPGVASDKDIQIAMEGFLPPTANPTQVASFLRGMGKLEQLNSEFHRFKAEYITYKRNTEGLLPAWEEYLPQYLERREREIIEREIASL